MNSRIENRLATLQQCDPISAGQLRPFMSFMTETTFAPAELEESRDRIRAWRREQGGNKDIDLVLVAGCNHPADLAALREELPESAMIYLLVYDLRVAARIYAALPLEEEVTAGKMRLAFGSDADAARARFLGMLVMSRAPSISIYDGGAADSQAIDFYTRVLMDIRESVHLNVFNIGTMIDRGTLWQHNTICNISSIIANPGVDALQGLFEGKPAIVVGAGPSLNDALDVLSELKGRFVIISTGTALRPLRRAGIRPDFVVAVDGSHKTAPQFETPCDDLYLACSSLVYPPVIPKFKGFFSGALVSNPIANWISTFGTPKGELIAAGTVTASAVDLAVKMGCAPIIAVGFDLCFNDDGTTHASNTMYHGTRVNPSQLVEVPGNLCEYVLTSPQFRCYILLMEEYIKTKPDTRFINATTGGARIGGMEVISPGQLAAYAVERFDAYAEIERVHQAYDEDSSGEIYDALTAIHDHLSAVANEALDAAMICNQLILMLRMPQVADEETAKKLLEELEEKDDFLVSARERSMFLDLSLLPIGFKMHTRRDETEERYSDAVLVNRRARELYEQIAGAARWTRDLLSGVVETLPGGQEQAVLNAIEECDNYVEDECLVLEEVQ